jgi:hypothetical protein
MFAQLDPADQAKAQPEQDVTLRQRVAKRILSQQTKEFQAGIKVLADQAHEKKLKEWQDAKSKVGQKKSTPKDYQL